MGDRMVATHRERRDAGSDVLAYALVDVLMTHLQPIAAAERHVADIGNAQVVHGRAIQHMVVGSYALNRPQRPRPEAGAVAVGDAKIHGHADDRDLQVAEIRIVGIDRAMRR